MSIHEKRVFIIVLDSFGIGYMPDAASFGDEGSNTLKSVFSSGQLNIPMMSRMGLFNIEGVDFGDKETSPTAAFARLSEKSSGKDTTIGHWELAGLVSKEPMPTFPDGFPNEFIREFERVSARGTLCNLPYSGTEALKDFGEEHIKTGKLIVYTSADSVFQIAAHEEIVTLEELYDICKKARDMLKGSLAVGRVIARPFIGEDKDSFNRTPNRHDFSLLPPKDTMLDLLNHEGYDTIGVGKIYDIFAGRGLTDTIPTRNNNEGIRTAINLLDRDFRGLAFINLVEFDMLYGHRNDIAGYTTALNEFDLKLEEFIAGMKDNDLLIITADHGCDPGYIQSTDHTREYVPMLLFGEKVKSGVDLKTRSSFADVSATILEYFGMENAIDGESFLQKALK